MLVRWFVGSLDRSFITLQLGVHPSQHPGRNLPLPPSPLPPPFPFPVPRESGERWWQQCNYFIENQLTIFKLCLPNFLMFVFPGISVTHLRRPGCFWGAFGRRALRSSGISRLVVPPVRLSTVAKRAFPVVGPRIWDRFTG